MDRLFIVCVCSLALSVSLFAQEPTASPIATTPPEVQKLDYYLGTWKGEGEAKGGPFGARKSEILQLTRNLPQRLLALRRRSENS
jgi:hypothetical protein